MPRFYLESHLEVSQDVVLSLDVVRHLQVLRIKQGESIELFNGDGFSYVAIIIELSKKSATANIKSQLSNNTKAELSIKLAMCVIANDKMDLVIQKVTELGVSEIIPVISSRTQRIDKARMEKRLLHWQNIIISSCEQCGGNVLPRLSSICDINDVLKQKQSNNNLLQIILSPISNDEKLVIDKLAPKELLLLVGPEGGFTVDELDMAISYGFKSLTLGNLTMRAETAAIAGVVALYTKFTNWLS